MFEYIFAIIVGIILIVIGIFNSCGHIETLHSYHRKRVAEEDIIPFGRKVGLGTIIIGASIVAAGILSIVTALTRIALFEIIGYVAVGAGLVIGCIFAFYAMIKYNKGIF